MIYECINHGFMHSITHFAYRTITLFLTLWRLGNCERARARAWARGGGKRRQLNVRLFPLKKNTSPIIHLCSNKHCILAVGRIDLPIPFLTASKHTHIYTGRKTMDNIGTKIEQKLAQLAYKNMKTHFLLQPRWANGNKTLPSGWHRHSFVSSRSSFVISSIFFTPLLLHCSCGGATSRLRFANTADFCIEIPIIRHNHTAKVAECIPIALRPLSAWRYVLYLCSSSALLYVHDNRRRIEWEKLIAESLQQHNIAAVPYSSVLLVNDRR